MGAPMGRLVINNAVTVNGAFEAPVPEPDGWLVLDADSNQVSLDSSLPQVVNPVLRHHPRDGLRSLTASLAASWAEQDRTRRHEHRT